MNFRHFLKDVYAIVLTRWKTLNIELNMTVIVLVKFVKEIPLLFGRFNNIKFWKRENGLESLFIGYIVHSPGSYMFKVISGNTRARCKICSKLTIKTPEWNQWHHFCVFIVRLCSRGSIVSFGQINTGWAEASFYNYYSEKHMWWSFYAKIVKDKKLLISNIARLSLIEQRRDSQKPC